MTKPLSKIPKKVLLNLTGSGMLKFTRTPRGYSKILEPKDSTWDSLNKKSLYSALTTLYREGLISISEALDGVTEIAILAAGKRVAEEQIAHETIIPPARWDRKWRLVFFDIPENKKNAREAFRDHLKKLCFTEFHK